MAQADPQIMLDGLINHITSSNNPVQLQNQLKAVPKDIRDIIFASSLPGGQDPLAILDIRANTLGMLYILCARLRTPNTPPPPIELLQDFCAHFTVQQARLAPDRVTQLAKGIIAAAEASNNQKLAIELVSNLLTRYVPDLSYLTSIHAHLVLLCIQARHYAPALPLLTTPITHLDTSGLAPDLTYLDNLTYHYAGGIIFAALKRWDEAIEFFEICVSSPGVVPSSVQLEGMKKLVLCQLISAGKTTPPPKYTHPLLNRLLKNTPYMAFVNSYPRQTEQMRKILEREQQLFNGDRNMGLLNQALERAPRWTIKKLTLTYLTLHLSEIGKEVGIADVEVVRGIILSMIESSEIHATLSADDTVTFSDPPLQFTKAQVDRVLKDAQEQGALLAALDGEVGRSREFLNKAVKSSRDDQWGAMGMGPDDEMMFGGSGPSWMDESMF